MARISGAQGRHAGPDNGQGISRYVKERMMTTNEQIPVKEMEVAATLKALNTALSEAGVEADKIISIHFVLGVKATVGQPIEDKYRVHYRS